MPTATTIEKTQTEIGRPEVHFAFEALEEDIPIKGNALASGDDDEDREAERWILDQLESGNEWAWCTVKATASFAGFEGVAYLGCCSYESREDFARCELDTQYAEALADLDSQINAALAAIPSPTLRAELDRRGE